MAISSRKKSRIPEAKRNGALEEAFVGPKKELRRSVLSQETYEIIREMILSYEIAPNEKINMNQLSLLLGVSPTPIREALARLEPEGLIEKTAHKGYAATDILSPKEFLDLYKFRLLIEPWAAEQAAKLATNCDKKLIKDEMAFAKTAIKYGKEEGVEALTRHDARFHNLISQMSRNNLISHAFERTNCHLHLFRLYVANQKNLIDPQSRPDFVQDLFETYYKSKSGKKALEEHTTIALAIVSGDSRLAQKAMKNHIESSLERFAHYQEE